MVTWVPWGHVTGPLGLFIFESFEKFRVTKCSGCSSKKFKKSFDKVCFKTGNQKHPNFRFDEEVETLSSFLFKKYFQSTKGLNFDQIFEKGSTNPVSSPSTAAQNEQGQLCRSVGEGHTQYRHTQYRHRQYRHTQYRYSGHLMAVIFWVTILRYCNDLWYFVKLWNVRNDF